VIEGFATAKGTAAYHARRVPEAARGHVRSWAELEVSSIGIGTYLGIEDAATDDAYREAVARALDLGINVVDSAVNYRHQQSERSVGAALRWVIEAGTVTREEVLVATKGGFIPRDARVPADAASYLRDTYVRTGIVAASDVVGQCHCVTPGFLATQIETSRRNLGVETIDVYYVHNPEMQLAEVDRATLYGRLRAAFELLEAEVDRGTIRVYGVATWTGLRQPPSAQDYLSLAELVRLAEDVAGAHHHFKVVELPYNLAMTEAFTSANQQVAGEAVSPLEAARRLGLYVMSSASIYQGQLARNLPPVIAEFLPGLETDGQRALQFVRSTPGVGTVLVGMRQLAHVEENARLASVEPLRWEEFGKLFTEA
jgi:aryl-alcohol dehydrogenase-like predicted oxidoreductase